VGSVNQVAAKQPRALRRRKIRLRALAIALSVFAFLGAEAFGVDAVFMDGRGMSALAAAARDPLSLIALRSPGSRTGLLQQTKPGRKPPLLSERGRRTPPPPPTEGLTQGPPGEGLPPPAPVFAIREIIPPPPGPPGPPETAFPVELAPPVPGPEDTPGVGGPGSGFPIGDFPGGGSGFTPPPTAITVPPGGPGVPEPSVWATLIVGFFAIGAVLRARRRGARRAQPARLDVGA